MYFADGKTEVGCFCSGNGNRTVLTSAQLGENKYLEQAFFAAEDRHFLTEGGISMTGTARAIMVDLTGSGYQGGSTITEQYVKTYFQDAGGNLTYKEKLKEIIDAIKLARLRSKPWILQPLSQCDLPWQRRLRRRGCRARLTSASTPGS